MRVKLLKILIPLILLMMSLPQCGHAPKEKEMDSVTELAPALPSETLTCPSTQEFIKTHEFIRSSRKVALDENASRAIAESVSKNCSGAFQRFKETYEVLSTMGVGLKPTLQIALKLSGESNEVQRTFLAILKSSYLSENFDFGFQGSINLAYRFSVYSEGRPEIARSDFLQFMTFCKDQKQMGLTMNTCAKMAVELTRLGALYQEGLYPAFTKIFQATGDLKDLELPLHRRLKVTYDVVAYGPLASENFLKAYPYALETLELSSTESLNFALNLAGRSLNRNHPVLSQARLASHLNLESSEISEENQLPGEEKGPIELRSPTSTKENNQ